MMKVDFCTCVDVTCPNHPANQDEDGCSKCVLKCLTADEIPACFYRKIEPDMERKQDYTFQGFARFVKDRLGI